MIKTYIAPAAYDGAVSFDALPRINQLEWIARKGESETDREEALAEIIGIAKEEYAIALSGGSGRAHDVNSNFSAQVRRVGALVALEILAVRLISEDHVPEDMRVSRVLETMQAIVKTQNEKGMKDSTGPTAATIAKRLEGLGAVLRQQPGDAAPVLSPRAASPK